MRISVIQMSPGSSKPDNLDQAGRLIEGCIDAERPDLVVLPEMWTCLGGDTATRFAAAEDLPAVGDEQGGGEAFRLLRQVAIRNRIHVHGGSIGTRDGDRLLNTSLLFAPDGRVLARYDKIHLFDIRTPSGAGYCESDTFRAGSTTACATLHGGFGTVRAGLAICYDLRFAEMFHLLRREGAELLLLPAAFTAETGEAHWETLLRARAIETQCWVAAAATVGAHHDADGRPRQTYGHSMVVDPWGTVTARASSGPGWAGSRIDLERLTRIRTNMPVMDHRRLA